MDDHQSFLTLFLRHENELRGLIGAFVFDPHERDDVFQEAALTLWRRYVDYDPAFSFGAWARGIVGKLILKSRSQRSRRPASLPPEVMQSVLDAFDRTEHEASGRKVALRFCTEQLPPRSREILSLRYEQQLKGAEIAQRLNTSLDAVHQMLSRIRSGLEECIRRRLANEESGERGDA